MVFGIVKNFFKSQYTLLGMRVRARAHEEHELSFDVSHSILKSFG